MTPGDFAQDSPLSMSPLSFDGSVSVSIQDKGYFVGHPAEHHRQLQEYGQQEQRQKQQSHRYQQEKQHIQQHYCKHEQHIYHHEQRSQQQQSQSQQSHQQEPQLQFEIGDNDYNNADTDYEYDYDDDDNSEYSLPPQQRLVEQFEVDKPKNRAPFLNIQEELFFGQVLRVIVESNSSPGVAYRGRGGGATSSSASSRAIVENSGIDSNDRKEPKTVSSTKKPLPHGKLSGTRLFGMIVLGFSWLVYHHLATTSIGGNLTATVTKTLGVGIWVITLWLTEVIPIVVTAFLPLGLLMVCLQIAHWTGA